MVTSEISAMLAHDERHWRYRGPRVLRSVLDELDVRSDAQLLDAGCGSGRTLDDLRGYGHPRGVDIDAAVGAARGRGHDVSRGPVERLPFAGGTVPCWHARAARPVVLLESMPTTHPQPVG